jgi:hypothetical protein
MKTFVVFTAIALLVCGVGLPRAYSQKGAGDPTGIARQADKPEVISLSGKVTAIESGPCERTTGRAGIGTHVLLETTQGDSLNIHLGPKAAVEKIAKQLAVGQSVEVKAFRTDKLPEDNYVAKSIKLDGKTLKLRDDSLRPVWAGGAARQSDGKNPPAAGGGYGRGRGAGFGRGPGAGLGYGAGLGRGCRFCPGPAGNR